MSHFKNSIFSYPTGLIWDSLSRFGILGLFYRRAVSAQNDWSSSSSRLLREQWSLNLSQRNVTWTCLPCGLWSTGSPCDRGAAGLQCWSRRPQLWRHPWVASSQTAPCSQRSPGTGSPHSGGSPGSPALLSTEKAGNLPDACSSAHWSRSFTSAEQPFIYPFVPGCIFQSLFGPAHKLLAHISAARREQRAGKGRTTETLLMSN